MRIARKLFLLAAMALATLALSATTANAQELEVHKEPGTGPACGTVTLMSNHVVEGGCHIEFENKVGEELEHIPLVAYIPTPLIISQCNVHLEAQIGENGEGYINVATLTDEDPLTDPRCLRTACDEANGVMRPWPLHIDEVSGQEFAEATFCLRPNAVAGGNPGDAGQSCEVHIPLTDLGGHNYEIGAHAEYFCEVSPIPPVPVSIRDVHFVNENPPASTNEDVEIIH